MKRFSLDEYLKNPSRKVVTRGGLNARIICTDAKSEKYQVVALVTKKGGQEILATFDTSGKYRSGYNSHLDLFFASEKREGWVNLYRGNLDWTCAGSVHNSKDEAEKHIDDREHYITTIKIEWEE